MPTSLGIGLAAMAIMVAAGLFYLRTRRYPGGSFAYGWEHPRTSIVAFVASFGPAMYVLTEAAIAKLPADDAPVFRKYLGDVVMAASAVGLIALVAMFVWRNPLTKDARQVAANLRWGFRYQWVGLALLPVAWVVIESFNPLPGALRGRLSLLPTMMGVAGFILPWLVFAAVRVFFFRSGIVPLDKAAAAYVELEGEDSAPPAEPFAMPNPRDIRRR